MVAMRGPSREPGCTHGGACEQAAKMAANWAKPHKLVEEMRGNLDADGLEAPQQSKGAQIRERARISGVQSGRVSLARLPAA